MAPKPHAHLPQPSCACHQRMAACCGSPSDHHPAHYLLPLAHLPPAGITAALRPPALRVCRIEVLGLPWTPLHRAAVMQGSDLGSVIAPKVQHLLPTSWTSWRTLSNSTYSIGRGAAKRKELTFQFSSNSSKALCEESAGVWAPAGPLQTRHWGVKLCAWLGFAHADKQQ